MLILSSDGKIQVKEQLLGSTAQLSHPGIQWWTPPKMKEGKRGWFWSRWPFAVKKEDSLTLCAELEPKAGSLETLTSAAGSTWVPGMGEPRAEAP